MPALIVLALLDWFSLRLLFVIYIYGDLIVFLYKNYNNACYHFVIKKHRAHKMTVKFLTSMGFINGALDKS